MKYSVDNMTIFTYITLIIIAQLAGLILIYFIDKKIKSILAVIMVATISLSIGLLIHIDKYYMVGGDAQLMFLRK